MSRVKKRQPAEASRLFLFVGLGGIEPPSHEPESCIMPLYHSPKFYLVNS